jgi:diaminopimelate decarboxylase
LRRLKFIERDIKVKLSWQILQELEQKYGECFYLLDINKFRDNYRQFLDCFRSIYPNTNIGYSYKTNYIPKICQSVYELGGYAEVVSQMEYDLAKSIGVPLSRIIFNGPLKYSQDLERAVLAGSIVNLDSLQEVKTIVELAKRLPEQTISVGLRCNFDIGTDRISRFGLDVENGDLDEIFKQFKELGNCQVIGLHCHFTTEQRSLESYALRAKKIIELSDRYFPDLPPKFIDVGGGYFGHMEDNLRQQFPFNIPTYREYAEVIATQFDRRFGRDAGPELIIEPGVALVANVMKFVGKIVGLKTIRSRHLALLTGSIHTVKPSKQLPLTIYKNELDNARIESSIPIDLVGYTCMEHDCLYPEYPTPVAVGDYTVFDNVGAYSIVFKPPFIWPSPPIVSYDATLDLYTLARRQETSQDVFATYQL